MLMATTRIKQHKSLIKSKGIAMTETLIALPVLLLLVLGGIQLALLWEAKIALNHAALMAARAGSMNSMDFNQMYLALDRNTEVLKRNPGVRARPINTIAKINVLNPTSEAFRQYGVNNAAGAVEIPNSSLAFRDRSANGLSKVSIQDANILRIMVVYQFELVVPIVNSILDYITKSRGPGTFANDLPTIPITAVATLRMQTPPTIPPLAASSLVGPIPIVDSASGQTSYILDLKCVRYLSREDISPSCSVADITGDWDTSTDYSSDLVYYGDKK